MTVAVGGALGATLRYLLALALVGQARTFPFSTLLANCFGCLLIGVAAASPLLTSRSEPVRLFLTVGLLGGFTTFSAFGLETHTMLRESRIITASVYVLLSLALGLAGVFVGHRLGGRIGV